MPFEFAKFTDMDNEPLFVDPTDVSSIRRHKDEDSDEYETHLYLYSDPCTFWAVQEAPLECAQVIAELINKAEL